MTASSSNSKRADAPRPSLWQAGWVNTIGRFVVLAVVFAFFALAVENGKFYTPRNLESILRQSAVYATAALGMTLVIIASGIDLSVGSIIALAVVVVAWLLNLSAPNASADAAQEAGYLIYQWPTVLPLLAVLAGVAVAMLAGAVNGMLVMGLGRVPFIVSLGTLGIWRGRAKGITGQKDI